ncbi:uncharacterized protein LOC125009282 [Mugil cephalus]|uniref:uncharacterized protein LOC125009282 n=1 Tax=Mugil cephalus TaxID=48193 RepID=UPI001FB76405|nr:uncharacterized protein LOC125009282 [Mugil cephalus]XP_047443036.1 uncharacterized protein LOC125009282 [Mugil cephalus]XP_047443037.1 uncharacterized protein LOC125009282 [Mugil cephalus]XP_047443038.1 uncharacterized protein LOC125009282 [Mugil cephalus]
MDIEYQPLSSEVSCQRLSIETSECFICRDGELQASDPLRNFCDCKNLLAHHVCLSTWIQTGCGSEDRLRCIICRAKYQLQRSSPWRSVSFQWRTWLVLITTFVLLGLVPYVVHRLMTAFTNPPPSSTFKVATVSFGLLSEILLLKCLSSYVSGRYRQAEQSSFTVRPRGAEDGRNSSGRWDQSESPSAVAGHASSVVSPSQVEERKVDMLKTGCLSYF